MNNVINVGVVGIVLLRVRAECNVFADDFDTMWTRPFTRARGVQLVDKREPSFHACARSVTLVKHENQQILVAVLSRVRAECNIIASS